MQYITQLAFATLAQRPTHSAAQQSRKQLYLPSRIVKEQPIDASMKKKHQSIPLRARLIAASWLRVAGGANRDRTDDLLLAKQALSQLSYGPAVPLPGSSLVGLDGFEPSTPALSRRCSNQLSYRPAWVAVCFAAVPKNSR